MSSETKGKRGASASLDPPDAGDHRKRRRNRTTQSCLNCHDSKRMCDRKRPACARCTQLGLTGLCVYEIDDPSQRSDSQDETARLLNRVAELEGVIRKLKNKPPPRLARSETVNQADIWHSRSHLGDQSDSQNVSSDMSFPRRESSFNERPLTRSSTDNFSPDMYPSIPLPGYRPSSSHSQCYGSSPQSTPSPSLLTPREEYTHSHVTIVTQPEISLDHDISTVFPTYPDLITFGGYGVQKTCLAEELCFTEQHGGHCGCLNLSTNYRTVLELSVRLRRAVNILATRSPCHNTGTTCLLNQNISDLDTFISNTLSSMITSQEDSLMNQRGSHSNTDILQPNQTYGSGPHQPLSTAIGTSSLQPWYMSSIDSGLPCDDLFMSWEPSRHTTFAV